MHSSPARKGEAGGGHHMPNADTDAFDRKLDQYSNELKNHENAVSFIGELSSKYAAV